MTTSAEQEIWEMIQSMNRTWTSGNVAGLSDYFHPDMVAFVPTAARRLVGRDACIEGWKSFVDMAKIHSWVEGDPKIQVYGDAAVVTYYYDLECELGGQRMHLSGRDMFTVVRQNGRWWAVADQFSSFPD